MKIIKKVSIGIFALVVFSVIGVFAFFCSLDPRISGTFKSDKEATIKYLKSVSIPTDKQLNTWEQMYGHLYYVFDGHKISTFMESQIIDNNSGSEPLKIDESHSESYFFIRRSEIGKDKIELIILPSPLWALESTAFLEIELDEDGFWLEPKLFPFINTPYKEKFTKIKS